jgi:hypothetical protein
MAQQSSRVSFDLMISGAFLPDIMPTLGLASALRRLFMFVSTAVCAKDGTPTLSHNMARVHQEPILERPSNYAYGRSQK